MNLNLSAKTDLSRITMEPHLDQGAYPWVGVTVRSTGARIHLEIGWDAVQQARTLAAVLNAAADALDPDGGLIPDDLDSETGAVLEHAHAYAGVTDRRKE